MAANEVVRNNEIRATSIDLDLTGTATDSQRSFQRQRQVVRQVGRLFTTTLFPFQPLEGGGT